VHTSQVGIETYLSSEPAHDGTHEQAINCELLDGMSSALGKRNGAQVEREQPQGGDQAKDDWAHQRSVLHLSSSCCCFGL